MIALPLLAIYAAASLALFVFGLNYYVLLALYLRRRRAAAAFNARVLSPERSGWEGRRSWPLVTTQIPVYNEANVAERVVRAVAAMDYPRERHEIQVLDDSTDVTCAIIDRVAAELCAAGHWVTVLRRSDRAGFKAGALQAGFRAAAGEFIAIFDADFIPPPGFLRQTVPFLVRDPGLGLVQGRWGHLNPDDSLLTRAQAIGIDGHFMIEQSARAFNGLMMNFNGTAGVWRRQAIADAGGWSADTLTEDLDLSYRAQLAGWRTHFVAEAVVPAELPADIAAFKSQQFRWAKGSIQTAKKLLPPVWRSNFGPWVKIQATLHLTHYMIHPLMLLVAVLALPVLWLFSASLPWWVLLTLSAMLLVALVAPGSLYLASQHALNRSWRKQIAWMPAMMCLGVGLAVSNARAIVEALSGVSSAFIRTPKQGAAQRVRYRTANPALPWVELALGLYCTVTLAANIGWERYLVSPFLLIYAVGFTTVAWSGLRCEITARRAATLGETAPVPATRNMKRRKPACRSWAFALAVAGLVGACLAVGWLPVFRHDAGARIAGFMALLPLGLGVVLLWPRTITGRTAWIALLGLAIVTRLALLSYPPGDDVHRYLWEGRLVRAGESPYARAADAPEWTAFRDEHWRGMNHRDLHTIYPPVAEWIFAAAGAVWYHPIALKLLFIAFDLGAMVFIARLLDHRQMPVRFAGIYAFNPVVLMGIAAEGHFDALLVFFVVAALWLVSLVGEREFAALLSGGLLAVWTLLVTWRQRDTVRATFWILGGLVILSPTVHYWYLAWPLALLPLCPSLAWLVLSGSMGLYFLAWGSSMAGGEWVLPVWSRFAIWAPFALLLLREAWSGVRWPASRCAPCPPPVVVRTFAVVVPTLNEAGNLSRCLESLRKMEPPPVEIIVADGGSDDATTEIARRKGALVVSARRGRGRQIAAGAERVSADAVLVLHADSTVAPDTGRRLLAALNANPAAAGGCIGQRFDADSPTLLLIEVLNEIRALFFGSSFGDQGQFFRRLPVAAQGGFPVLPLMEDVEFSLRLRAAGPPTYLGGGVVSSDRRWRREKWLARCLTVLTLTIVYRIRRREGDRVAAALYRKYYAGTA